MTPVNRLRRPRKALDDRGQRHAEQEYKKNYYADTAAEEQSQIDRDLVDAIKYKKKRGLRNIKLSSLPEL